MTRGIDRAERRAVTNLKGGDRTPGWGPEPGIVMVSSRHGYRKRPTPRVVRIANTPGPDTAQNTPLPPISEERTRLFSRSG